jgi:hypothetical protein
MHLKFCFEKMKLALKNKTFFLFSFLLLFTVTSHVHADAETVIAPLQLHSGAEHNAAIRFHRLERLKDRVNSEPSELAKRCRYVSDIAAPAPLHQVVLSFDDGPEPIQTELILQLLERYKISASFFMIGEKAKRHPNLVQEVLKSGRHLVGNHSWSHPNFHTIAVQEQAHQVNAARAVLVNASEPKLFRYPYGNSSCESNALLKTEGYKIVGWHVDSCDWAFDRHGSVNDKEALECGVLLPFKNDYVGHVLATIEAHRGGIVLMHETHPNTIAQLETIIKALIDRGFAFGALSDTAFQQLMH